MKIINLNVILRIKTKGEEDDDEKKSWKHVLHAPNISSLFFLLSYLLRNNIHTQTLKLNAFLSNICQKYQVKNFHLIFE